MQALQAILKVWRQPKPVIAETNSFSALDRAAVRMMRVQAAQIEAARRYWVCLF